jgi:hypothetical protein
LLTLEKIALLVELVHVCVTYIEMNSQECRKKMNGGHTLSKRLNASEAQLHDGCAEAWVTDFRLAISGEHQLAVLSR